MPRDYIQAAMPASVEMNGKVQARCNVTIEAAAVESVDQKSIMRQASKTARELRSLDYKWGSRATFRVPVWVD